MMSVTYLSCMGLSSDTGRSLEVVRAVDCGLLRGKVDPAVRMVADCF